jgi:sialidase-1
MFGWQFCCHRSLALFRFEPEVDMRVACILAVSFLFLAPWTARAEPEVVHVDVFTSGADGYHSYRIPAIETAADGSLVAFAEARKHNLADPGFGKQDIDLVVKRSSDGGKTWSKMQMVEDPGELWSAANPATVVDRTNGRLWVLYLRSKPERSTRTARAGTDDMQTLARHSDDHGVTWSEPIDLTEVARDMDDPQWRASVVGPGGMIQDRNGRLIAPVCKVAPAAVFTIYSDDHGATWQRGEMVPGDDVGNEDQLVELADGRILIDVRQIRGPHRQLATSRDGGHSWTRPRPGETVGPVACAIERYTLASAGDDRNRIVWTGPKGPGRTNLVVRTSCDEGETFGAERQLSTEQAAYSDLTILQDNSVGVLWERGVERGYQFITFTRFNLEFLETERSTPPN